MYSSDNERCIKGGGTFVVSIDFLIAAKPDTKAAPRFLNESAGKHGKPGLVNIDKSGGTKRALISLIKIILGE